MDIAYEFIKATSVFQFLTSSVHPSELKLKIAILKQMIEHDSNLSAFCKYFAKNVIDFGEEQIKNVRKWK